MPDDERQETAEAHAPHHRETAGDLEEIAGDVDAEGTPEAEESPGSTPDDAPGESGYSGD